MRQTLFSVINLFVLINIIPKKKNHSLGIIHLCKNFVLMLFCKLKYLNYFKEKWYR